MKSDLCTISLNVKYSTRTFEILSKSTIVNEFSFSLSCHNVLHYENVSSDWYLALSTSWKFLRIGVVYYISFYRQLLKLSVRSG